MILLNIIRDVLRSLSYDRFRLVLGARGVENENSPIAPLIELKIHSLKILRSTLTLVLFVIQYASAHLDLFAIKEIQYLHTSIISVI